jgi:ferredoxin
MPDTLRVNPIACTGHGVCAELLPELISLDEWGYPIVDPHPVPPALDLEARRAVAACPTLALKLMRTQTPRPVRTLLAPGGTAPRTPRTPR